MNELFEDSINGVKDVLQRQLDSAADKRVRVQQVILTGGLGKTAFLRRSVELWLKEKKNVEGLEIDFVVPRKP
jgi:DNA-nicking Smr family endonuclease